MKMDGKNGKLLMFGLFFIFYCKETSSDCKQLTPCSCKFPNGYGYSLWTMVNSTPLATSIDGNSTLLFHPCTNEVLIHQGECNTEKGVSVCLVKGNDSWILGKAEETHITVEPVKSIPMFTIHHDNYTITITLDCCASCPATTLSSIPTNNNNTYNLSLSSHHSCGHYISHKGLSTGSILVILFFTFTGLYFIIGTTWRFLGKATGWEMIPDHKFWRELPSYVKDGFFFTINCCHTSSYQSI